MTDSGCFCHQHLKSVINITMSPTSLSLITNVEKQDVGDKNVMMVTHTPPRSKIVTSIQKLSPISSCQYHFSNRSRMKNDDRRLKSNTIRSYPCKNRIICYSKSSVSIKMSVYFGFRLYICHVSKFCIYLTDIYVL